ncbi:class I SAM-dependent methyltransferase [Microlunatus soli]|uniref:Methyltransferase domain-containing protein n=1 Tax=Microlunatus soli TaxID=630515 RepID=A0A1H2AES2_9ACTN|nr:class I SAM-dependent methyltransferase [Microlunatus soli]SDT44430.1 Methyltransferase domain-containing protein [Microlunatus soli]
MSTTSTARYDSHADWFIDYSSDWRSAATDYLPEDLSDQRVLDLACGFGQLSRPLADRGATVVGVDLAGQLIDRARQQESEEPRGVSYHVGSATATDWWDGTAFDGVVCNMALMDIDDLDAALATVRSVLRPGGWFTATLFHPCYPGDPQDPTSLPSWPPDRGYDAEGWWTTGQSGVRGHVGAHHRKLSSYLNAVLAAGLQPTRFDERSTALPTLFVITATRS